MGLRRKKKKKSSAVTQNDWLYLAGCCRAWLLGAKFLEFPRKEFTTVIQNMNAATNSAECTLNGGLGGFVLLFEVLLFVRDIPNVLFVFFYKREMMENVFFLF